MADILVNPSCDLQPQRLETAARNAKSACLVVFLFGGNPLIKTPLRGLVY